MLAENLTKATRMAQKYFKANHLQLEKLRVARGWSREQLASKAIVSTRTLDSIMAGKQAVLSTFSKLAKALDTPVNTIVEGYEVPEPNTRLWSVTITISTPFDSFDEVDGLPEFLTKLLQRIGGNEVGGPDVFPGSTQISLYLTESQYYKLMHEYEAGNLNDLGVIDINVSMCIAPCDTSPPEPEYREAAVEMPSPEDKDDSKSK
jgi:transcriptional regulator with XRE-family HTH domain